MNLQNQVNRHEGEFDLHSTLLKTIQEDLETIIRFANPNVVLEANQYATTNPNADPVVKEKCLRFVERWRHLVQQ